MVNLERQVALLSLHRLRIEFGCSNLSGFLIELRFSLIIVCQRHVEVEVDELCHGPLLLIKSARRDFDTPIQ